nr:MAG TPA: Transcriptional regulator protein (SplA) [Caudoviricetes sp.]
MKNKQVKVIELKFGDKVYVISENGSIQLKQNNT